ncbi:benzoate-CoA ligase family protein [Marinobacterium sp. xm-a-152]|uniref:benzoate-CoA ligase family protein n=1 Tax=Marinobacterium sp. xm-a-152 TaxID=2497733 RepID=UPI001569B23D|nr:benzoate-CoA ligase family protein [Marinobacterium sp. xm-a-152]NRP15307.1 Benzoate--CoA ligase [Marinobacterium sp. xm-a-152]
MDFELSSCDHSQNPPVVNVPRNYNAAYDLMQRNLNAGFGDKLAYIDDQATITFSELDRRSNRLGSSLNSLGVQAEQRVFLCALDTIDWPVSFLGCIKAGVLPIAVNTLLTSKDYEYMLNDSRAKVAIIDPSFVPTFKELLGKVPTLETLIVTGSESVDGCDSVADLEAKGTDSFVGPMTTCDDPCFWLYSSGSTGAPKGTVHIHSSIIQTAELFGKGVLDLQQDDVVFSAAKLFFAYGLGNAFSFPLSVGATTILYSGRPTPDSVYERLEKHSVTVFCGVPTLYAGMLAKQDKPAKGLLPIRMSTSAGEALPAQLLEQWREEMGSDIIDGIGSTEMLHIFLSNAPGRVAPGTTGQPVPGYEVKLLDADDNEVPSGEIGDLVTKGPSTAIMYWNNRAKSTATFQGEWTRSGDKFYINEEGNYVYAGRSDDMLKVSGIYVSPAEVEATLIRHPAVLEAAVVGAMDDNDLVKPKAYIILKESVQETPELNQELKDFVKANLAPHKYPRWFIYVTDLPKTATGKIQRFKLRELG